MTATELAASSVGYLLTAALAGRRYGEASTLWQELDVSAQAEVIAALGVQARIAVREAGIQPGVDFTRLAETICAQALGSAQAAYEGTGAWRPPQCSHCRELVASALAEIHLKAGIAAGMSPSEVDLNCRNAANA